ncbi:hypothetical protein M9H77_23554 [Catharanthus roseus]|uniref:Uncharacterized protein n=1 Tax=Catharanthus roseus TaxID=4058 RepID=A0ACC0AXQ1_CATRO|nr:hypothetical protein M9H77_23554 [Catharanthus roseus]
MLKSSSSRSEGQPSQQEAQHIGAQPLIMWNTLTGFAIIAVVKLGGSPYDLFLNTIKYVLEGMAISQGIDADITPKHAKASFRFSPEVSLGQASTISVPIPRSK